MGRFLPVDHVRYDDAAYMSVSSSGGLYKWLTF